MARSVTRVRTSRPADEVFDHLADPRNLADPLLHRIGEAVAAGRRDELSGVRVL